MRLRKVFCTTKIDQHKFLDCLIKTRSKQGFLAINVHASHLIIFQEFFDLMLTKYPKLSVKVQFLGRRSVIKQAVSYYIASSTKVWSANDE